MIVLTLILVALSFLQATLWPLQLVLLILIFRSLIKEDRTNFYLAFGLGLLASLLGRYPLGLLSILYLTLVLAIYFLRKTNVSNQLLIIFPIAIVVLVIDQMMRTFLAGANLRMDFNIFWQLFLVLPIYIMIRFWEERFTVKKDVKLKIK